MTSEALKSSAKAPSRVLLGKTASRRLTSGISFVILCFGAVLALIPILWMLSTSLKAPGDVLLVPPQWIPNPIMWSNYIQAMTAQPFNIYFWNTTVYTLSAVFGETISSAMVAYALARLRGPWHRAFFIIIISTMMLPWQVTLIPQFLIFRVLNWVDTLLPLIVPTFFGSAFFIFLLHQFYLTIPDEMEDAGRIDGANEYQIFWWIILPMSLPALATVAIMSFMYHWNNFMGPLDLSQLQGQTGRFGRAAALHGGVRRHPLGPVDGSRPGCAAALCAAFLLCPALFYPRDRRFRLERLSVLYFAWLCLAV